MEQTLEFQEKEKPLPVWDLDSRLYDSYELVSLSHHIERHLMTLPSLGVSNVHTGADIFFVSGQRDNTHGRRSSMFNNLSESVKARLSRRNRRNGLVRRFKEKPKKVKAGVLLCGFLDRFGV